MHHNHTTTQNTDNANARLLVVEDNPVMVAIIGKILKRIDLSFAVAPDGGAAIDACRAHAFDMVLMDINMPKMNGIDAAQILRTLSDHYRDAPIIAVTANLNADDIRAYKTAGMTDCVKKPVNQVDLHRIMEKYLDITVENDGAKTATQSSYSINLDQIRQSEMDVLNWETFKEYSDLMKGEFPSLLAGYLRAGPLLMDALSDAVFDKDAAQIVFLAHKLKSTSIVFGAESVSHIAAKLEACGQAGDTAGAGILYNQLHVPFEGTNAVLKKRLTLMRMGM